MWQAKQKKWQSEMLFNFTKKPIATYGRRQWRAFASRKIPFTRLGSPPSDAVLAMERNGDYVLTLGNTVNDTRTGLALRFYGIHSAASMLRQQRSSRHSNVVNHYANDVLNAPLLQTTPLHFGTWLRRPSDDLVEDDVMIDQERDFSLRTTPAELIVSKDWKVGIALLYPAKNDWEINIDQDNGQAFSMVLFTLPRRQCSSRAIDMGKRSDVTKVFNFSKAPVSCYDSQRKMLWTVDSIPNKNNVDPNLSANIYNTSFRAPGYLLVNDEMNGVRFTWATEKYFLESSCLCEVSVDSRFLSGSRRSVDVKILSHEKDSAWIETQCDTMTGEPIDQGADADSESDFAQVSIVNESFLHLDVLLADVLSRRKGISESHPVFYYSLISVSPSGRIADFVIVFERRKKACLLGFFVTIDLFSGMFVELDWVRSKMTKELSFIQKWCNKLAVNRRMRDLRAGPFSVTDKHSLDCTRLCIETFTFDNDEEDDYDETYWREFVRNENAQGGKKCKAPKLVTMSSLYPSCDVITNQAIINFEPVFSIRAKGSPIQLVYA
jgi:hypothetical protein